MKIQDIFTTDELALIDSGNYKPGRAVLDAKLDLAIALEREACANIVDKRLKTWASLAGKDKAYQWLEKLSAAIRARGNT